MLWSHPTQNMEERKIIDRIMMDPRVSEHPVIITNHSQEIVGVNNAWINMCGYSLEETLGQTPRLLQGQLTNRTTVQNFYLNLCQGKCCFMSVINYKKDQDDNYNNTFVNHIFGWCVGDLYVGENLLNWE